MEYDNGDFVPAGSVSAGDVPIDGMPLEMLKCRAP